MVWSGYWSGLPLLPPGDLPDPGIEPVSPKLLHSQQTIAEPQGKPPADLGGSSLVPQLCPALATPWTVARQAPLSMGFSRQEYQGGLPFPSPGDLTHPGIEPRSPALQADS